MTAPAWLVRASEAATVRAVLAYAAAEGSLRQWDYAQAGRDLAVGARWGMAAVVLGRLVQALGGPPGGGDA